MKSWLKSWQNANAAARKKSAAWRRPGPQAAPRGWLRVSPKAWLRAWTKNNQEWEAWARQLIKEGKLPSEVQFPFDSTDPEP